MSKPERLYTIGEAADLLEVSVQTIRYYESEGLVIPIRRNSRHRRYTDGDLERIRCLRRTINRDKVSIAGIKHLLAVIPCWTIKNCAPAARESCRAYVEHNAPCWSATEKSWEYKSEQCRLCPVYTMTADCSNLKQTITRLQEVEVDPLASAPGEPRRTV